MRPSHFISALLSPVAAASFAMPAHADPAPQVVPPVVIHHVDAIYPPSALKARRHTDVVLIVTVDTDGHVSHIDVKKSGGSDLDEAAKVAMREWTFVPAMRNGTPVASRIKVPFHFAPPAAPPELVETPHSPGEVPVHEAVQPAPAPPPKAAPLEVTVASRARSPSRGASDFEVPVGKLEVVPRNGAGDFLKLAPGVLVTNEGGEGHADSIVLRGFDAGEGESLELSVGGVPINDPGNFHGNGYADTHFIIPETIESLRVLEGPLDPHQGNFAVAGSANYELGLAERGLTAKWTTGSYGAERLLLTWGPQNAGQHTFAAAEYAESNGFGDNRNYQHGSAIAQYEGDLGDRGTFRLTAQAYSVVAGSAGVIREDDYDAGRVGFYGTYDPNQGQDSSRYSIAADLEKRFDDDTTLKQQVFLIARSLRIREDFTGYVTEQGTPDSRGTGFDLAVKEYTLGARGSARKQLHALGQPQELELGYFARGDSVDNVERLLDRATQIPYATNADLGGFLGDMALYADANLKPLPFVSIRGGAREEVFTYTVENHCPETTDCTADAQPSGNPRTSVANSRLLPRVSLIVGPFQGLSVIAGFGRGVRSLAIDEASADPKAPLATISSYEGGVSFARRTPLGALSLRSALYDTEIDRDEILDPVRGRVVQTGATRRTGFTGAGRLVGHFYDIAANAALVRGVLDATGDSIPYVPHFMARADTAFFTDLPWSIGGHAVRLSVGPSLSYVGTRSLPLGLSSAPYFLLDAGLKLTWRPFELGLMGTNLLDTRYRLSEFTFISDFHTQPGPTLTPARSFTAGAPRMVFLSLSATLGG